MKQFQPVFGIAAILALIACLASAILFFTGAATEAAFKSTFLVASIAWFVFAWLWRHQSDQRSPAQD